MFSTQLPYKKTYQQLYNEAKKIIDNHLLSTEARWEELAKKLSTIGTRIAHADIEDAYKRIYFRLLSEALAQARSNLHTREIRIYQFLHEEYREACSLLDLPELKGVGIEAKPKEDNESSAGKHKPTVSSIK